MDILKEKIEGKHFHLEDYFPEFSSYKPPQDAAGKIEISAPIQHFISIEKREQGDTEILLKARFFIRDQFLVKYYIILNSFYSV